MQREHIIRSGLSRRAGQVLRTGLRLALLLALALGPACRSQSGTGQPGTRQQFPLRPGFETSGDFDPSMTEKRVLALNVERQKQMVADTNKLLKLARELKEEVASNGGTLAPEQLRKVAEIEKLARSVKERMSLGTSQPQPPFSSPGFVHPVH